MARGSGGETTQKILEKKRSGQSKTDEKNNEDFVKARSEAILKNRELLVEKCEGKGGGRQESNKVGLVRIS